MSECCLHGESCSGLVFPQVLVGQSAPEFTAPAVLADGKIVDAYDFKEATKNKYAVIFFYPLDFTFVCPTELIAFDHHMAEFKALNVEVIGVSIDSHFTHNAWRNTPVEKGGIGQVGYTLVADLTHEICQNYGVESAGGVAYRGSFLIDKKGVVRHMVVNDLPLGRSVEEMIRMVEALQHTEEHGEVCPAGWTKGKEAMKASPKDVAEYLAKHAKDLK